jgi:hypothetical protein
MHLHTHQAIYTDMHAHCNNLSKNGHHDSLLTDVHAVLITGGSPGTKRKATSEDELNGTTSKKFKGCVGLIRFSELPLDNLYQIFANLLPIDSLHISRVNKDLRNVLTNPSSAYIWNKGLSKLEGSPECPKGMNLFRFLGFVYGGSCYVSWLYHQCYFCVTQSDCCSSAGLQQTWSRLLSTNLTYARRAYPDSQFFYINIHI